MALPPKDRPPQNQRSNPQPNRRPRDFRANPPAFAKSGSPLIKALLVMGMAVGVMFVLLLGYAFLVAKPNLPKISALVDYNPKTPLRVYTADKVLIGEFGEERRKVIPLSLIHI